jgi:hypothetical protein
MDNVALLPRRQLLLLFGPQKRQQQLHTPSVVARIKLLLGLCKRLIHRSTNVHLAAPLATDGSFLALFLVLAPVGLAALCAAILGLLAARATLDLGQHTAQPSFAVGAV